MRGGGRGPYVVKVAPHNMNVGRKRLEKLESVLSAEVPRAQHVLDAPRHQQLLELLREIVRAVRDVDIANNQHKLHRTARNPSGSHAVSTEGDPDLKKQKPLPSFFFGYYKNETEN